MVSVTTAPLAARHAYLPQEEARGKGRRIADRSGAADAAAASLPEILPGLRDAFLASTAAGAGGGGGYAAWLSQELARRRLFEGDGLAPAAAVRMHSFSVQRYSSGSLQ
ncbi:hypothetical protein MNEG_7070 [Monoraphidium neglectum]|uniref:Uncharacterized protein n=1 Tax=Monoraphidium neglectum TaxID=145388 RepID=A0A0D2JP17_9CHLO|nr:hypothetical protein MNEG_7070 [Monoraphidium neglectum]KIZ00888.1 hypothetical protein MNEG_7070 [Monoraphidium neglectum]|eukprot:XP_013899907.1 hypothetical protein MNEG_7070 [Monoraphidium neglectum]